MSFTNELKMARDDPREHADEILVNTEQRFVSGRELQISRVALRLSPRQMSEIGRRIEDGLKSMQPELATHVQREFAQPTLLARIDCTDDEDLGIRSFEIEERPAGLDVTEELLGECFTENVHRHFTQSVGQIPVVVRHPEAHSDDGSVLKVTPLEDIDERLCIVRARPNQIPADIQQMVQSLSVSTVLYEGRKDHTIDGENIKYAKDIEFSTDESIVLKPAQGTHAHGVAVYLSPKDREVHGKKGTVTAARIQRLIEENPDHIVERFLAPMVLKSSEGIRGNMILRVFGLVRPEGGVEIVGGAYVIRRELVVHGASNAITGAVTI